MQITYMAGFKRTKSGEYDTILPPVSSRTINYHSMVEVVQTQETFYARSLNRKVTYSHALNINSVDSFLHHCT